MLVGNPKAKSFRAYIQHSARHSADIIFIDCNDFLWFCFRIGSYFCAFSRNIEAHLCGAVPMAEPFAVSADFAHAVVPSDVAADFFVLALASPAKLNANSKLPAKAKTEKVSSSYKNILREWDFF